MRRFEKFDLKCEVALVSSEGCDAIRGVKHGHEIRDIITSDRPILGPMALHSERLIDAFRDLPIIGLGITSMRMEALVGDSEFPRKEPRIGLSRKGAGAVISINRFRDLDPETASEAIQASAAHELGHVFGVRGHCSNPGCIMEENKDYLDFVDRFVRTKRDFCRACGSIIRSSIASGSCF